MHQKQSTNHNKKIGARGEDLVVSYMTTNGYQVCARNVRTKLGEIDIVATKNNTLYCIEVKTRSSISFGYPSEAITSQKLQRMKITAQLYAIRSAFKGEVRLLVAEVLPQSVNLIEIDS